MKQIIKIVIIILIGSLLSGCVEKTNQTKLVDMAGLQDDQLRESDNLEIVWYNVFDDEHYWSVTTLTSYQPFLNMLDDENHDLTMEIKHRHSIHGTYEKMNNEKGAIQRRLSDDLILTNLTKSSYKVESYYHIDSGNFTSVSIIIHKDKCIGTISAGGYSNIDKCNEVVNYYAPIMNEMLKKID